MLGFCKSASLEEIRGHGYVLTPGRYVGAVNIEDSDVPFAERFSSLQATLNIQFDGAEILTSRIQANLAKVIPNE